MVPAQLYLGKTYGTLTITSMLRRDDKGAPIWIATCHQCGTRGVLVPHRRLEQGNATCTSSLCGPTIAAPARQERQVPQHSPEGLMRLRWAQEEREREQRQWEEQEQRIAETYLAYKRFLVLERGLPVTKLPTIDVWRSIGAEKREEILMNIEEEKKRGIS